MLRTIGFNEETIESDADSNAYILTGVYCCGWVRTGPTGVILSTLNEGRETAKVVVKDLNEGGLKDRKIIYSHQCLVSPYSHEMRNVTVKNVGHQVDELTTVTFKEQCQAIFNNSYTYKYCTKMKKIVLSTY